MTAPPKGEGEARRVLSDIGRYGITPGWWYELGLPLDVVGLAGLMVTLFADRDGVCFPSRRTIAEAAGVSRRTVDRALRRLRETPILEIENRFHENGDKTSSVYRVRFARPVSLMSPGAVISDATSSDGIDASVPSSTFYPAETLSSTHTRARASGSSGSARHRLCHAVFCRERSPGLPCLNKAQVERTICNHAVAGHDPTIVIEQFEQWLRAHLAATGNVGRSADWFKYFQGLWEEFIAWPGRYGPLEAEHEDSAL